MNVAIRRAHFAAAYLFIVAVASSLIAMAAPAQSFRGSIRAEISDSQGLPIADARVTVRNIATSETREGIADSDGVYVFRELPAGEYEVAAIAHGFQEFRQPHVLVSVGAETSLVLELAKPTEVIERTVVTETLPLLSTTETTLSQVVERQLVQELPLNGRDFGKLVALTPGVTVEGSGVAGSEKGFGQFNINGNRDRSNNYMLDGTDNNDPFFNNSALNQVGITGAPATLLPLDAIEEFNLQSQFNAEYGRNSGSAVNIITRSGTNTFHGSLYEYNRNSAYDARNYFNPADTPKSRFNNNNFGGSLGGPVATGKTFFFFAYEGQRERVGSDFNLAVPSQADITAARNLARNNPFSTVSAINPALDKIVALFPTSDTNSLPFSVRDKNDNNNLIAKIDHRFSDNLILTGRYAFGQSDQIFPLGSLGGFGSGSRLAPFAQQSPTRVQVISLSLLDTLSANKLNEIRFGYSRFRTGFTSADANGPNVIDPLALGLNMGTGKASLPEIDFNGDIENLGATAFSVPRGRVSETFQILDNLTWVRSRHTFKFGGEYHRYDVQSFNDNLERGLLDVNTTIDDGTGNFVPLDPNNAVVNELANFYIGNIFAEGLTGNTARFTFNNNLGFFAQDEIRLRPNLTLTAGLRWEYYGPLGEKNHLLSNFDASGNLVRAGSATLPHVYNRDLNNFGPRLGLAWNPRRNTVVRAAYGVYYDYIPQNVLIANFTTSAGVATNPTSATDPSAIVKPVNGLDFDPNVWNGSTTGKVFTPTTGNNSLFITDRDLRTPYVQSWNLNLQQQLGSSFAVETGYVGSKGTKLTRLYDKNQDFSNPNYNAIDVFSTGANSTYNAWQSTVRLQNLHGFSGFSTYAWSKSLDGASDAIDFNFATAAFPQNSDNLKAEKGPSTFDTRHRWTSAINYQVPRLGSLPKLVAEGWQLNSIVTVQSGRPIGIVTANDTSGTFNFHQRPNVVPGVNPVLPNWTPTTGYLNPAAFAQPADGTFGDLGRNQVFGPGFWNVDFSTSKTFEWRDRLKLQFRTELFNIFNHPNFALPSNTVNPGNSPAGVITQTPDVAQGNPGLGGGGPRVLQFGLRLQF
jgi:outer membrane receptor protein involved in Fe transport